MTVRVTALFLYTTLVVSGLLGSGLFAEPATAQITIDRHDPLGMLPDTHPDPGIDPPGPDLGDETPPDDNETETEPRDPRDGRPAEWEEQVAADARGDVLARWPGTVDLLYLTVGELFTFSLGETYMLLRVGYNITTPDNADLSDPNNLPQNVPNLPEQIPDDPLVTVNVTFNVTGERTHTITLYTDDYGLGWLSNQGLLIIDKSTGDHREVLYLSPLRRFSLEEGDTLSDWNITSHRGGRLVDTMESFDPINDPLPRYLPAHALFPDPDELRDRSPVPLPPAPGVPAPPVPVPPSPVPLPSTEPRDHVDNDPYPYPPEFGRQGVPYGVGTRDAWLMWLASGGQGPPPVDTQELLDDPVDHSDAGAYNVTHRVTEGKTRFIVRHEKEFVTADLNHVAIANFSVENLFTETDQRVMMLVVRPPDDRWLMRYGLDMPRGMKTLPAGERIQMSAMGLPSGLFAKPMFVATFIFISDWGGLEIVPVRFVSLLEIPATISDQTGDNLPDNLLVDIVNKDDPFRVNEPRNIMVSVKDADTGAFFSRLEAVRAYIYPVGGAIPHNPYQLEEKPWMDGVYEVPFTFNRPGAWVVDVYFYDYTATGAGLFPHIKFIIRVDYPGQAPPIVPVPMALASVAVVFGAISLRERLAKAR